MKLLKLAILAAPLLVTLGGFSAPAVARTGVSIDFGNVALGYRDGYYDQGHRYHRWARRDAMRYRTQYHDNYRDMAHGRDRHRSWNH
jgi:hypothetical protein